jgi:RimJ/RimL family protein N-acetyltransferase
VVDYRPASIDDAELASDLMTAAYPAMAHDPVMLRYRWENPRRDYASARFIAEKGERPIAFLSWLHGPWAKLPDRHCEVEVWLDLAEPDHTLLSAMWTWIGDKAVAEGTGLLLAYCGEDEPETLGSLAVLGYHPKRTEKVWELDLKLHGARIQAEAEESRRKMAADGIELVTIAAWSGEDNMKKLHQLDAITRQDIPTTLPILAEAYDDFVRRTKSPDRRADRTWVALDGDRPVALSYLKFPPVRGTVWTGYTCSHPEYRGRGLARAVKLETLAQAAMLGIPDVRTDNDSENAPMLHINERLGYVRRPGFVEHHKRVRENVNA